MGQVYIVLDETCIRLEKPWWL